MAEATAYQFRVALRQISPKIWRRVQLLGAQSLADLHFSIQVAMGWTDEFQHRFTIRNHRLGISRPGGLLLFGDPYKIRLEKFAFRRGERFAYEYNFYDAWEIEVRFEGSTPPDPGLQYPRCVAGAHRAPTEDCGGPEVFMERWQRDPEEVRAAHTEWLIAPTIAVETRQDPGRGDAAGLDGQRDAQEFFPMGFDQIPIDDATIQMCGPCQPERQVWPVQYQVLPITDARQQFDAEKMRKTKPHGRLTVRVRVTPVAFKTDSVCCRPSNKCAPS